MSPSPACLSSRSVPSGPAGYEQQMVMQQRTEERRGEQSRGEKRWLKTSGEVKISGGRNYEATHKEAEMR